MSYLLELKQGNQEKSISDVLSSSRKSKATQMWLQVARPSYVHLFANRMYNFGDKKYITYKTGTDVVEVRDTLGGIIYHLIVHQIDISGITRCYT